MKAACFEATSIPKAACCADSGCDERSLTIRAIRKGRRKPMRCRCHCARMASIAGTRTWRRSRILSRSS